MADIRINDLPLATGGTAPAPNDNIAIDGLTTRKTTIQAAVDVASPIASQAEAIAGTNNTKRMTPLATAQAIEASLSGIPLAVPLSFDGITSSFSLGVQPNSENNIFVFVNGVPQLTSAYSVSGTTITFTSPPPSGSGEVRFIATAVNVPGLAPGTYTQYTNPFLISPTVSTQSQDLLTSHTLVASSGSLPPSAVIEYTYNGDAAVGLDFPGAPGGSVPGGLYVQHQQTGATAGNNAFTHSIMAYALNNAAGDNDVIAVSGRVRKNDVTDGVGDAAGVWGSAYQYSTKTGLVMAAEATVYQNVAGNVADDRLNSSAHAASTALHIGSYSTGSKATAGISIDGSGQGMWNGVIVDGNSFGGTGTAGTVAINGGSWDNVNGYPEIGIKMGRATYHMSILYVPFRLQASAVELNGSQILSNRKTGWGAPTGTATRTTFATSTVTLPQLAERLKALIDDLTSHGLIGS